MADRQWGDFPQSGTSAPHYTLLSTHLPVLPVQYDVSIIVWIQDNSATIIVGAWGTAKGKNRVFYHSNFALNYPIFFW